MDRIFTFIDLFSGAGGFSEGFLLAGTKNRRFKLVIASDIQAEAKLTHENRFKNQLSIDYDFIQQDIRDKNFISNIRFSLNKRTGNDSVDVIIGGPPCQGFSVFGKRDEDDPRNDLFRPYLDVITTFSPKYFVMENVPGLELMYGGKTVERIFNEINQMQPLKYNIRGPIYINAADFGVPQLRERIVFIGNRIDMPPIYTIPPTHKKQYITVEEAIGDLSFLNSWEKNGLYQKDYPAKTRYQRTSRRGRLLKKLGIKRTDYLLHNHEAAKHTPKVIARFSMIEVGKGYDSIPKDLWESHLRTSKKWCIRLDPNKPSNTIVTLPDDFIHYSRHRILTVREMARLQSFDDTFVFLGPRSSGGGGKGNKKRNQELPQYSQIGNAVPPLMAKAIGNVILKALDSTIEVKSREIPD